MSRIEVLQPRTAEVSRETMPLSFVPEAKKRFSPRELVSVAGHELNHTLVAISYGVPVVGLSVRPEGDSLGRTVLSGIVSQETMKIIAAAGGVETHDGCAQGFGSDKHKVDVIHHFHGGHSWESAKTQAANSISRFSKEVREKAAEIVAYLGEVSGLLIYDLMRRAQMEVNEEKGIETVPIIFVSQQQKEFKNYTIIDDLSGNMQRITYKVYGVVKKEELLCGVCQGINGHEEGCPKAKLSENSEFKSLTSKPLPIRAVIFSAKLLS